MVVKTVKGAEIAHWQSQDRSSKHHEQVSSRAHRHKFFRLTFLLISSATIVIIIVPTVVISTIIFYPLRRLHSLCKPYTLYTPYRPKA